MPLIDLRTDLKSLKYGSDRPGGGDSNEPFIQNDINDPSLIIRDNNIQDGFIRGGISGAIKSSATDLKRITKFLTTKPQGPLFIARQIGLQLSNPRVERRSGPFGTAFGGLLEPTRIYNAGLNTLAQIPVNAFGGHFKRHGLQPFIDERTMYESVVRSNAGLDGFDNNIDRALKNNRLLVLKDKLQIETERVLFTTPREARQAIRTQRRDFRRSQQAVTGVQQRAAQTIRNLPAAPSPLTTLSSGVRLPNNIPAGIPSTGPINVSAANVSLNPSTLKINTKTLYIDKYIGGPESVYGIGETVIRRYSFTGPSLIKNILRDYSSNYAGKTRNSANEPEEIQIGNTIDYRLSTFTDSLLAPNSFDLSASLDLNPTASSLSNPDPNNNPTVPKNIPVNYFNTLETSLRYFGGNYQESGISGVSTQKPSFLDQTTYAGGAFSVNGDLITTTFDPRNNIYTPPTPPSINIPIGARDYAVYKKIIDSRRLTHQPISVTSGSIQTPANQYDIFATGSNGRTTRGYSTTPQDGIHYVNSYGDHVRIKFPSWDKVSREQRVGSGRKDEINLTPIFTESGTFGEDRVSIPVPTLFGRFSIPQNIRDLVRFRIQAINTNSPNSGRWMVFRAYLTDLSDDVTGEWDDIKYTGRGEKFYIYSGFTRKINVSFKIATLSVDEMQFVYQKLNYLMSNTMPDYSGNLMRGPLTKLSIGNWIDTQTGIINNISFKVPQDSPWEINLDGPEGGTSRLILPHIVEVSLTFTPIGSESKGSNRISQKSENISNIAQNNTGNTGFQYIR